MPIHLAKHHVRRLERRSVTGPIVDMPMCDSSLRPALALVM